MVNGDFPRYAADVDEYGTIIHEEYAIGKFYVKTSLNGNSHQDPGSSIYNLKNCVLFDEFTISQPIWLDFLNINKTLDKLQIVAMLS